MTSNLAADEIAQYGMRLRREAAARAAQRARAAGLAAGKARGHSATLTRTNVTHTM